MTYVVQEMFIDIPIYRILKYDHRNGYMNVITADYSLLECIQRYDKSSLGSFISRLSMTHNDFNIKLKSYDILYSGYGTIHNLQKELIEYLI